MQLYVIRRESGWTTPQELQAAAARSLQIGNEEMSSDIRWIRSYVVHEADGGLGTVCIYQATSEEKIREHARRAHDAEQSHPLQVDPALGSPELAEQAEPGLGGARGLRHQLREPGLPAG